LVKCIESGLNEIAEDRIDIQNQLADVRRVAATLDPETGSRSRRRQRFVRLQEKYSKSPVAARKQLSQRMTGWIAGLFVCVALGKKVPWDNLALERFFRVPKGHERHIHGHKHVGMRVVREGATLVPTLDAHHDHPGLFTAEELIRYHQRPVPLDQQQAQRRHQVMRRAASKKLRPKLLQELNRTTPDKAKTPDFDDG
jgi:hypothetical protein